MVLPYTYCADWGITYAADGYVMALTKSHTKPLSQRNETTELLESNTVFDNLLVFDVPVATGGRCVSTAGHVRGMQ